MRARRPEVLPVLAGLLGLALGWRPVSAIAKDPDDASYVRLVERYASGDREAAVAALRGWGDHELWLHQKTVLEAPRKLDGAWLRAAVMLHSDADEVGLPAFVGVEQRRPCSGQNGRRAAGYAGLLAKRDDGRAFARRFFLAMAYRCHWECSLDEAEQWAGEGLDHFPDDPQLLLALGAVHEHAATTGWGAFRTLEAATAERERRFKKARRLCREALAADPGLVLARLRLGRVHWHLGEGETARTRLEEVLTTTHDPALLYLAYLFLGQVHEDAGRLEPAVAQYQMALDVHPGAQAAAVALSHALRLAGDAPRSRDALTRALAEAGRRGNGREDEYWNYLSWPAIDRGRLFDELHQEAVR